MNETASGASGVVVRRGNAGLGRPKGALNKSTQAAKEVIAIAADRLGGPERLVAWAKENPANERAFWSGIYPRLLPVQVGGDPNNPFILQVM
jgi:hypothetical protein